MNTADFLLGPIYLAIFYAIGSWIASRNSDNPIYRIYYMKGLQYKLFGSVAFAFIYVFYYKGGDTINFYLAIRPICKLFFTDPETFFHFVTGGGYWYPNACVMEAANDGVYYLTRGTPSLTTIRIGALIDLLCLNSFFALSFAFAFISYQFIFRAFALVTSLYPKLHKNLGIAFLMIPSVIFWGSGIGKDSIMLGAIMLFFYSYYNLIILKRSVPKYLPIMLLTGFVITLIRAFILFTLVPCLLIMTVTYYRNAIRSSMLRFLVGPIFVLFGIGGSVFFVRSIGSEVQSYSLESLQKKAEGFQSWHTYLGKTEGGSTYNLGGEVQYTTAGVVSRAPLALVVTLFGPFLWQIRSPVMFISGMESLFFLYFALRMLVNRKIYSLGSVLLQDHLVTFCIPFSIILAVAMGLTSFNYGALVRYKIPILPFFATSLLLINYHLTQSQTRKV